LLKKVSDPAKLPVLTRSANRESISYSDSYDAGGGAERFFNKLLEIDLQGGFEREMKGSVLLLAHWVLTS
jgi:hypothetical protein